LWRRWIHSLESPGPDDLNPPVLERRALLVTSHLLDLARALRARSGPGDEPRAVDMLRRAEREAHMLGMRRLTEQAALERSVINAQS